MQVVLPGDIAKQTSSTAFIKLGPGVTQVPVLSSKSAPFQPGPSKILIAATRSGILGTQNLPARSTGETRNANATESCWIGSQGRRVGLFQDFPNQVGSCSLVMASAKSLYLFCSVSILLLLENL